MESEASLSATEEGCDWVGCKGTFCGAYNDVTVIPEGSAMHVKLGRVALCCDHLEQFITKRQLVIDWDRIFKGELAS